MFRVLPIQDRYIENPLPPRTLAPIATVPDPLVEVPYLVRSRLHSLRDGEPGWDLELDLLDAMTPSEFEELVKLLMSGVKEFGVVRVVRDWAKRVRAATPGNMIESACGTFMTTSVPSDSS